MIYGLHIVIICSYWISAFFAIVFAMKILANKEVDEIFKKMVKFVYLTLFIVPIFQLLVSDRFYGDLKNIFFSINHIALIASFFIIKKLELKLRNKEKEKNEDE